MASLTPAPPTTKGYLRFSIALALIPLIFYSIAIAQFLVPRFSPAGLTLATDEHVFVLTVLISNILLIVATGYLILALIKAELNAILWHAEFVRGMEATHEVSKAKANHCSFANTAQVLYDLYNATHGGELKKLRLGLWVNRIKAVFDQYSSSGQCAVCIKMFDTQYPQNIRTKVRDDISKLVRGKIDKKPGLSIYEAGGNTAFAEIMSEAISKDWFFCNDLELLKGYSNTNPHWKDFYNTVIVAPIKPTGARANEHTVGFLCVDSKDGKFDDGISTATLVFFAGMLYDHLQNTVILKPES